MSNLMTSFTSALDMLKAELRGFTESISEILNILSNFWVGFIIIILTLVVLVLYTTFKGKNKFSTGLGTTKNLIIASLFVAVNVVLSYLAITVNPYIRIGFGFIVQPVAAAVLGPIPSCIIGIIQDLLTFILKPTGAYMPGYSISIGIGGIIYGMFLYKKKVTFLRVFVARLVVSIAVNVCLSSLALAPLVGAGLVGILPARIIKEIIMVPFQALMIYIILKAMKKFK
ncbi:MAG: folate family ECF transporter S component [Oscillospiraceae bacterium]